MGPRKLQGSSKAKATGDDQHGRGLLPRDFVAPLTPASHLDHLQKVDLVDPQDRVNEVSPLVRQDIMSSYACVTQHGRVADSEKKAVSGLVPCEDCHPP